MDNIDCHLNLYQTPSLEILQYRKDFYGLLRRSDEQSAAWLKLVKNQMNRCEFPMLISRDYLLIDRFICNLNSNAREFVQSVDTWTLQKLNEYFVDQDIVTANRVNVTISIDAAIDEQEVSSLSSVSSLRIVTPCEFVSISLMGNRFFLSNCFDVILNNLGN